MDIFLGVGVVIIVGLLVVLIVRRPAGGVRATDLKTLEERIIRMEGELTKINPAIDRNFRENRKEIAENLERLQSGNEKNLARMQESNEKKLEEMSITSKGERERDVGQVAGASGGSA